MEQEILNNLKRLKLNFTIDSITMEIGNCFYEAVLSQCRRPGLHPLLSFDNPHQLRLAVVDFVRNAEETIPYVTHYRVLHDESVLDLHYDGRPWSDYLDNQERNGRYAEELFIKATSVMLGLDILVTSEISRMADPFVKISKNWNDAESECDDPTVSTSYNQIYLGHLQQALSIHFAAEKCQFSFSFYACSYS